MRKFTGFLIALSLLFVISAPAVAQENAGEDEYTEGVPGGDGESPAGNNPANGSDAGSGTSLPPGVVSQLQSAGDDGAAAAALAEEFGGNAGAKNDARGTADSANGGAGSGTGSDASPTGTGGLAGVVDEILSPDSDSGLGIWLPIILGVALLAALVAGIARIRSSRTPA